MQLYPINNGTVIYWDSDSSSTLGIIDRPNVAQDHNQYDRELRVFCYDHIEAIQVHYSTVENNKLDSDSTKKFDMTEYGVSVMREATRSKFVKGCAYITQWTLRHGNKLTASIGDGIGRAWKYVSTGLRQGGQFYTNNTSGAEFLAKQSVNKDKDSDSSDSSDKEGD